MLSSPSQVVGATLRSAWQAWEDHVAQRHRKRTAAAKALYFWMSKRLRSAFDTLR